jgi:hypothetical protein
MLGLEGRRIKVNMFSLCLTKYRVMKTYWGTGAVAPRVLDFGNSWRLVVSFKPRLLYPLGKTPPPDTHWIGGWVGPRVGLDTVAKGRNIIAPARN